MAYWQPSLSPLTIGKTEAILFGPPRKLKSCVKLKITCNGINIENKECVTYLGAEIDKHLNGEKMAKKLLKMLIVESNSYTVKQIT